MNLLSWIGRTLNLKTSGEFFTTYFGGGTWAGEPVNSDIVMQLSTPWNCIRKISGTMATLPLGLIARDGSGKEGTGVLVDTLIRETPNDDNTNVEFWEAIIGSMELVGNGFAQKHYSAGQLVALTLLNPGQMQWEKLPGRELVWIYTNEGVQKRLAKKDVFHLRQFSFDGVLGLSTVQYGAQTFAGARAGDRTANQMFSTGLANSGFLETGQVLNEPDRERLQKIMDEYRGAQGVGKIMILEAGMKWNGISMTSEDSELLMSRKWSVEEMCRWFDMPPILVGHSAEGGTMWGSGVENVIRAWYQLGLRNRIRRVQSSIWKQLLTVEEKRLWMPKYNVDALLQGDSAAQASLFSTYTQNGIFNRNEARAKLDMPPYPGGEVFTGQVNLAPVSTLGDKPQDAQVLASAARRFLGIVDAPPAPHQITDQRERT